jgi:fumarate hydratase class II
MTHQYRIERDTMGEVQVPVDALYRAQTQRAVDNFPISGRGLERSQIRALGLVKAACARVNAQLGVLDPTRGPPTRWRPASMTRSFPSTCSRPARAPART